MELLCERIKRLRKERNLTQTALAGRMLVTTPVISYWETGSRSPIARNISKLARTLQVTTDYLLNGREAPRLAAFEQAVLSSASPDPRLLVMVRSHKSETA